MSNIDSHAYAALGIAVVFLLVLANGFFVAAEFSLVAVRRSRVAELVTQRRRNAVALRRAVDHLDANLAATQLGITISSVGLGWIGEPAVADLIMPLLASLPDEWAAAGAEAVAITIAFSIITTLHIVLGELAPRKSRPAAKREDGASRRAAAQGVRLRVQARHFASERPRPAHASTRRLEADQREGHGPLAG